MLPVLSRLAREFATFDAWYSDGTDPALRAVHAARETGWSVFYPPEQGVSVIALEHPELIGHGTFAPTSDFHRSIRAGALPRVSVIEPRSLFAPADLATSALTGRERGPDVRYAERLLHEVYSAVRAAGPNVALIVLAGGGGGSRDPLDRTDPDGSVRTRVAAILVSAFARTGTVAHEAVDHAMVGAVTRARRDVATDRILLGVIDPTSYRRPETWPATTPAWTPDPVPTQLEPDDRLRAALRRAALVLGSDEPPPDTEAAAIAVVRAAGDALHPQ
jgi:hypothetical protein